MEVKIKMRSFFSAARFSLFGVLLFPLVVTTACGPLKEMFQKNSSGNSADVGMTSVPGLCREGLDGIFSYLSYGSFEDSLEDNSPFLEFIRSASNPDNGELKADVKMVSCSVSAKGDLRIEFTQNGVTKSFFIESQGPRILKLERDILGMTRETEATCSPLQLVHRDLKIADGTASYAETGVPKPIDVEFMPSSGAMLASDAGCKTPVAKARLESGVSKLSLFYKAKSEGQHSIGAEASGYPPIEEVEVFGPVPAPTPSDRVAQDVESSFPNQVNPSETLLRSEEDQSREGMPEASMPSRGEQSPGVPIGTSATNPEAPNTGGSGVLPAVTPSANPPTPTAPVSK